MDEINSNRPVSRRYMRSERMSVRLEREITRVAKVLHEERIRQWAAMDEGDYPRSLHGRALAEAECAVLIRALGALVELEPHQFDADAQASRHRILGSDAR